MMNRKIFVITFLILHFTFFIGLQAQDTWIKDYDPFSGGIYNLDATYEIEDIRIVKDGGYVVSGSFDRWIDDEPPMWWDHWGFLMKTDSEGNLLWAKIDSVSFLSENDNRAFVETEDGDIISTGAYYFGGGYMIKRDSEGNRIWDMPIDDIGVFSMDTTNDGNIIMAGRADYNPALRKISTNGEEYWTSIIDTDSGIAFSVATASDGGFLITGENYNVNNGDILAIKTDSNGDSLWTRSYDGYGDSDQGNCVIETNDNKILIIGEVHSRSIDTFFGLYSLGGNIICELVNQEFAKGFSVLDTITDGFIGYSWGGADTRTHLYKFTEPENIVWDNQYNYRPANGDRCFQEIEDGGFICLFESYTYFTIIKTDSNGIVNIDDDTIPTYTAGISLSNYPNPFNPLTTIKYEIGNFKNPVLEIFNLKGEKLLVKRIKTNDNEFIWNASGYASGVYFYRIKSDKYTSKACKTILLK
jgi:hypothetical protein